MMNTNHTLLLKHFYALKQFSVESSLFVHYAHCVKSEMKDVWESKL